MQLIRFQGIRLSAFDTERVECRTDAAGPDTGYDANLVLSQASAKFHAAFRRGAKYDYRCG
jgi:hypothetical protein